ncbi:hypothetical protein KM043_002184 [Ampulex compressa]|nr:hypothetical protein KM043_002184 [Ampulex compressa]
MELRNCKLSKYNGPALPWLRFAFLPSSSCTLLEQEYRVTRKQSNSYLNETSTGNFSDVLNVSKERATVSIVLTRDGYLRNEGLVMQARETRGPCVMYARNLL